MLAFVSFVSFLSIVYAYAGYPLLLKILPKRVPSPGLVKPPESVTVIVAARNERDFIAARLDNLLSAEMPVPVQILVCSDASDDGTDEIVRSYEERGVQLVRSPERNGKEYAQRLAVTQATGEIIIFTDAKVRTEPDLIRNTLPLFSDPSVGAISSFDKVEESVEGSSGEGMYVRYEMELRDLESQYFSLVGLSGSCFAVRKEIALAIRDNVPSDFSLLIETVRRGFRGVIAPNVPCYYRAVKTEEQEFSRKVRTVLRGISALFSMPEILWGFGGFSFQVVSHKLFRWLVPWFLLIGSLGAYSLSNDSWFWWLVAFVLSVFYGLTLFGYFLREYRKYTLVKVPLFFMLTNLAIAVAWGKYLRGQRAVAWSPTSRA